MKNYFSSIDLVHGAFVGTIYDASNNMEVYKTPSYGNETHALQDINNYLQSSSNSIENIVPTTNTIQYITAPSRKCCGG
jgi:hypothetical protein